MDYTTVLGLFRNPLFGKIVTVCAGTGFIILFIRFIRIALFRHIRDTSTRYRAGKFMIFLGYVLVIVLIAGVFSSNLGGIHIAIGMAGAGIAFSLQEVIASVAGWFAVSFGGFFKTGDRVQLGGIKGDVIDIGILRSTIMEMGEWIRADAYTGRVVRVANSFVFKEPVYNYSGDFPFLWDEITLPIRYGSDISITRKLIESIVREMVEDYSETAADAWKDMLKHYLIDDQSTDPAVFLSADENWITFTARYVVDYRKRRLTKDRLYTRLLEEIDTRGDEVRIATSATEITLLRKPK